MAERRYANRNWIIADEGGTIYPTIRDGISAAILMDIRDELRRIRQVLECPNTLTIPRELRGLRRDIKALHKASAAGQIG